jgi:hypothetical protein
MKEEEVGTACSIGIRETKLQKKKIIWKHEHKHCVTDLGRGEFKNETDL